MSVVQATMMTIPHSFYRFRLAFLTRTYIFQFFPMALRLQYFPIRGFGEYIRTLLIDNQIEFVDEKILFEEWPAKKETMVSCVISKILGGISFTVCIICEFSSIGHFSAIWADATIDRRRKSDSTIRCNFKTPGSHAW